MRRSSTIGKTEKIHGPPIALYVCPTVSGGHVHEQYLPEDTEHCSQKMKNHVCDLRVPFARDDVQGSGSVQSGPASGSKCTASLVGKRLVFDSAYTASYN